MATPLSGVLMVVYVKPLETRGSAATAALAGLSGQAGALPIDSKNFVRNSRASLTASAVGRAATESRICSMSTSVSTTRPFASHSAENGLSYPCRQRNTWPSHSYLGSSHTTISAASGKASRS
jgi:hypothetical protein